MAESRPFGVPKPASATFRYDVGLNFIEEFIAQNGVEPSTTWDIAFDLQEDVTDPDLRRRLRAAERAYRTRGTRLVLPAPVSEPEELLAHLEPWLAKQSDEHGTKAFEEDMVAWIGVLGSERLRTAYQRGYKVNRLYAQERLAAEVEGAWVDTSGAAKTATRTDPSMDALTVEGDLVEDIEQRGIGSGCEIRWVTEPPPGVESWLFEPQEAVAILDYLGRYTAYLFVDSDLANPGPDGED